MPSIKEAEICLENLSHDPKTSCIHKRIIESPRLYDLDIIIPCYNVEKYINICIDSIIKQKTSYSFRIIAVNDSSQDKTGDILDNYAENYPNIGVIHQKNKSFSGSRNSGLDLVRAEYVMFVDSDDYIAEGSIQCLMQVAYKYNAAVVQGQISRVSREGKFLFTEKSGVGRLDPLSLKGYPVAKVIRSNYWETLQFPPIYWFEDSVISHVLSYMLAENNDLVIGIPEVVYNYRKNPKSITFSAGNYPKAIDTFYITRQLFEDRKALKIPVSQRYYDFILRMVKVNFISTSKCSEEVKKSLFVLFRDFIYTNFQYFSTDKKDNKAIEKAIKINDYFLYKSSCKW